MRTPKVDQHYYLKHISPKAAIVAGYLAYAYDRPPVSVFQWICFVGIIVFTLIGGFISWDGAKKIAR